MNQSCRDPDTGNTCEIAWVMETWLASKVPAEKEARAFRQAWAEALGIGGSIGGAAIGAATGELIGGLTGMFKKKKQPAPQPKAATDASDARVTAFTITMEVTDWSEIVIPQERFEEPVDWKKL